MMQVPGKQLSIFSYETTLGIIDDGAGLLAGASTLRADFVASATLLASTDNATNSSGSGSATVDYNAASQGLTYSLSWANLTGPAIMGHIHVGGVGVNGPVVLPFFMTDLPATTTFTGTSTQANITPAGGVSTIADVAQQIAAGNAYVNIHTAEYPAGEIRGQLALTPEPGTTGLIVLAAAGGLAFAWRRRMSVSPSRQ